MVVNDKVANVGLVHALQDLVPDVVVQFAVALILEGVQSDGPTVSTGRGILVLLFLTLVASSRLENSLMPKPRRDGTQYEASQRSRHPDW